jgi:hypothetical protein
VHNSADLLANTLKKSHRNKFEQKMHMHNYVRVGKGHTH